MTNTITKFTIHFQKDNAQSEDYESFSFAINLENITSNLCKTSKFPFQ